MLSCVRTYRLYGCMNSGHTQVNLNIFVFQNFVTKLLCHENLKLYSSNGILYYGTGCSQTKQQGNRFYHHTCYYYVCV